MGFAARCRCSAARDLFTPPLQATGRKKKARFPEAKRFMPLLFSFTSVTKPARGLNRDEVRCDRKKKNDKLQLFFVFTLWI